ncbi:hypothetical protein D9758_003881 [Tetrapyrgos nigripes]|uniref:Uncharacterized protein n=1 Tax=Tetrapyrgos nigripes TaxID=182062 RepID=A0A8H5LRQ7_9AGAR|nr:hypothetical protein D9758_003881 [Tetrapyrgos nigripes]
MSTPTRRQPARKARDSLSLSASTDQEASPPQKSRNMGKGKARAKASESAGEEESEDNGMEEDEEDEQESRQSRPAKKARTTSTPGNSYESSVLARPPITRVKQTARRAVPFAGRGRAFMPRSQGRVRKRSSSGFVPEAKEDNSAIVSVQEAERRVWRLRFPEPRYYGDRPHMQSQSPLFSLPPEIVDIILGDRVHSEREHLALSGTCTALRMGYSEAVWEPMLKYHTPFSHNQFTYKLLQDPCNLSAARTIDPEHSGPIPAKSKLWSTALGHITDKLAKPGIDFTAPCYKAKHKRCQCMKTMGPNHAKVISNVNLLKTTWGHIFLSLSGSLSETVNYKDFESVERSNTKGEIVNMYCLATVDAAILKARGGVYDAMEIRDVDVKRGKRRKAPKDRDW